MEDASTPRWLPARLKVRQDAAVMLIQEEAVRPAHPLATLDEDYEKAVLHLAWDRRVGDNQRTLLFALVELLPSEVLPPLDDGEQGLRLGSRSEHHLHLRRVVVRARQALNWYLDCRRGIAILPDEDGRLRASEDPEARRLGLADLGEEPSWPTLVCVSGESDTVPFCPSWHEHPRVHHLVPLADLDLEKLWAKPDERKGAAAWLEDRLHFSLGQYPEYWGSVHLVAPNPVYRRLNSRLLDDTPPRESILIRVQPRAGHSVEGLELTVTEKQPWGPLDVRYMVLRSPLLRLDYEHRVGAMKKEVFDPTRGMLRALSRPSIFFRSIRRPGGSRLVSMGEGVKTPSARSRLAEAHQTRSKRRQANVYEQGERSGQNEGEET